MSNNQWAENLKTKHSKCLTSAFKTLSTLIKTSWCVERTIIWFYFMVKRNMYEGVVVSYFLLGKCQYHYFLNKHYKMPTNTRAEKHWITQENQFLHQAYNSLGKAQKSRNNTNTIRNLNQSKLLETHMKLHWKWNYIIISP